VIVATLLVALVVAGFYLLYLFSNVLFVLFVAIVFATALRPAVLWLERRGIPQPLGTLLLYLTLGLLTAGVLALAAPLLVTQVTGLSQEVPQYYSSFRGWISETRIPLLRSFASQLPAQFPMSMTQASASGTEQVSVVTQAISYIRALGWSIFGAVAIGLIAFFWIVDREQIIRAGLLAVPVDRRDGALEIYSTLEEKVGAFVRGQALLCLSIGVLSAAAFLLIGLPNALLLGVLAGILEAVPYIGPIATAVLAVALTLAQSPEKIWWVVGACVLIQQIENAVLVPRIMDRTVGVNAVVTLLAIAAFGTLLGVGGAIMAIPLAVIVQVLFDRLLLSVAAQPGIEIVGRDQVAVLRYQAQDLAQDLRDRIRSAESDTEEELIEEELEAVIGDLDQLLQDMSPARASSPEAQPI
jgi:predicted PurR-regulated permease PerM